MTGTVITDSGSTTVVATSTNTTIVSSPAQPATVIVTGQMGPRGASKLLDMQDLDTSNLRLGSILVYDTNIAKWVSTTLLNQQQVDCGEF